MEIENIKKIKIQNKVFPEETEFFFTRITLICSNNLEKSSVLDRFFEEKINYSMLIIPTPRGTIEVNDVPLSSCHFDIASIHYVYYPENNNSPKQQWEYTQSFAKTDDQYIIRTDSDFILNGFLIEIKKGNIKLEDFSIIFFDDDGNFYTVKPEKSGYISHRPLGFFDTLNKQLKILVGL